MLVTPRNLAGLQNIPISADYDHSNDDFAVWFVPFLPNNRCRELLFVLSIVGIASCRVVSGAPGGDGSRFGCCADTISGHHRQLHLRPSNRSTEQVDPDCRKEATHALPSLAIQALPQSVAKTGHA